MNQWRLISVTSPQTRRSLLFILHHSRVLLSVPSQQPTPHSSQEAEPIQTNLNQTELDRLISSFTLGTNTVETTDTAKGTNVLVTPLMLTADTEQREARLFGLGVISSTLPPGLINHPSLFAAPEQDKDSWVEELEEELYQMSFVLRVKLLFLFSLVSSSQPHHITHNERRRSCWRPVASTGTANIILTRPCWR